MKLLGLTFASDVHRGDRWFPFDDLTVIAGANDAGKSTTLGVVHDALAGVHESPTASPWEVNAAIVGLTLELAAEHFDELLSRTCQSVSEGEASVSFDLAGGNVVLHRRESNSLAWRHIRSYVAGVDDPRETWIRFIRAEADLEAVAYDAFFKALAASSVIDLQPAPSLWAPEELAWSVTWCLPGTAELSDGVRAACSKLSIDATARPNAPVRVLPVVAGTVDDAALPTSLWVPRPPDQLEMSLDMAAVSLASACSAAREVTLRDYDDDDERPAYADVTESALRNRAASVLAELIRAQLPPFISDRYNVAAGGWGATGLSMVSRRSGRAFPFGHLAEGLRLWVQLATFDAVGVIERSVAGLRHGLEHDGAGLDDEITGVLQLMAFHGSVDDDAVIVDLLETIARHWPQVHLLHDFSTRDSLGIPGAKPVRLYVIDEPERHLHPALQRRAARWLRDWCRKRGVQCLVATHAPAFLALSAGVQHLRVRRAEDDRVEIDPMDPRTLTADSDLAVELGFDRGELLAFYRVVLFVEGTTDVAVLEALLPDRVREIGILLCPLHGVKGVRAIPTAQLLFRLLGVPFAVLVDNDPLGEVRGLFAASEAELRTLSGRRSDNETVHVARMLAAARAEEVHVEPFSIRSKDVLGLLAPEAVVEALVHHDLRGETTWNGMEAAMREFEANGGSEKIDAFLSRRYGIRKDVPELFTTAAHMTRRLGAVPEEAVDLFDALERLSLAIS